MSLFSVLESAWRPPGVRVKFRVSQGGGWERWEEGRRMIRWSRAKVGGIVGRVGGGREEMEMENRRGRDGEVVDVAQTAL